MVHAIQYTLIKQNRGHHRSLCSAGFTIWKKRHMSGPSAFRMRNFLFYTYFLESVGIQKAREVQNCEVKYAWSTHKSCISWCCGNWRWRWRLNVSLQLRMYRLLVDKNLETVFPNVIIAFRIYLSPMFSVVIWTQYVQKVTWYFDIKLW